MGHSWKTSSDFFRFFRFFSNVFTFFRRQISWKFWLLDPSKLPKGTSINDVDFRLGKGFLKPPNIGSYRVKIVEVFYGRPLSWLFLFYVFCESKVALWCHYVQKCVSYAMIYFYTLVLFLGRIFRSQAWSTGRRDCQLWQGRVFKAANK